MSVVVRVRKLINLFPARVRGGNNVSIQNLREAVQTESVVSVVGETNYVETPFDGNVDLGTFE